MTVLYKSINSEKIKEEIKWAINGIDIVGCGLSQNISKKLKENLEEKYNKKKIIKILDINEHLSKTP